MWTVISTPIGRLRLVASGSALTAVDFVSPLPSRPACRAEPPLVPGGTALRAGSSRPARGAQPPRVPAPPRDLSVADRDDEDPLLRGATDQLTAYFAGDLEQFDLPLAPEGTPFQMRVWALLGTIPYGETVTYGELAGRLAMTGHGARAVGLANGRNPLPVIVPCHRVVGAGGALTGYGGGVARKQWLLAHEQTALF